MMLYLFFSAVVVLIVGAPGTQCHVYELKQNGTACIHVDATFLADVFYKNKLGQKTHISLTLGKPSNQTSGVCDYQTPGANRSELALTASGATLRLGFHASAKGGVTLSDVSLTVEATWTHPKVTLTAQPGFPLSADTDHRFVCPAGFSLDLTGPVEGSRLHLNGQVVIQAFRMHGGNLSGLATECAHENVTTSTTSTKTSTTTKTTSTTTKPHNITTTKPHSTTTKPHNSTTTKPHSTTTKPHNITTTQPHSITTKIHSSTTLLPTPATTPSPEPPLLNLTVLDKKTNLTCLALSGRLQLSVRYLVPGRVLGPVNVPILADHLAVTGDCGADVQTLRVTFFKAWRLTLNLTKGSGTYGMSYAGLEYNLNNSVLFPNASYTDRALTVSAATGMAVTDVPSNDYYSCSELSQSMTDGDLASVQLGMRQLRLQAFRTDNSTDMQFTGGEVVCPRDQPASNVVPIAVGAALAGLVVIVLAAYLISRRLSHGAAARNEGYQSV